MTPKLLNSLLLVASVVLYYFVATPLYYGGDSILLSPGENNVTTLIDTNKKYDATIVAATQLVARAKVLQKQYSDYDNATLDKLNTMVPDSINSLVLLDELTRIFNDAGPVDSFGIKDKGAGEFAVSFSVSTTYTQFKQFMTYWEKSMRLFSLQSVAFVPGKKEEDIIKFSVELMTYYLDRSVPAK